MLIILNKVDVLDKLDAARETLSLYPKLGYPLIEVAAKNTESLKAELIPRLAGKTTLLMGQSVLAWANHH